MDTYLSPGTSPPQLTPEEIYRDVRELAELADQITELVGHLNAANYRFLKLIGEFDRRKGWVDNATHSCAHWLNWKCGIAMGAAREKVRTARALENLPLIAAAMERGEISYSKVRAITRVACPATENNLLNIAIHGTAEHVETIVRHFRRGLQMEELSREARQQKNRYVSYQWDQDGSFILRASLPAEVGAQVLKALNIASEDMYGAFDAAKEQEMRKHPDSFADKPSERPDWGMKRADALGLIAESFLQHGAEAMTGDRHQIVIHVSAETLRDGSEGRCEFEDGPSFAAETARRLGCDTSLVGVVENDKEEPLSVGRKTRTISPALRRALNARDQGCRFPGCTHKRFVDAHHIHHWAHGGETKPSNLVTLCRFHHRIVHEGGVRIEMLDDGAFRFVRPDGRAFDSVAPAHTQPLGNWQRLPEMHREQGIHIDRKTGASRWDGDRPDYDLGVLVLLDQARRGKSKDVPAETPKHISIEMPTDVPAETPPPESVHPNDIVWASIEDHPGYQEMQARIAERQRMFAEEDREYRRLERKRRSRTSPHASE
jgi:hypothetical protein